MISEPERGGSKMKKKAVLLAMVAVLCVAPWTSAAGDNATIQATWAAPTVMGDTCLATTPISGVWTYTVQYRVKGSGTWSEAETASPAHILTNLYWNTTYEVRVGAHRAGRPVLCWTAIVEQITANEPSPGPCGSLVLTK
jgi:hypothetical protein